MDGILKKITFIVKKLPRIRKPGAGGDKMSCNHDEITRAMEVCSNNDNYFS